jgi:hypothetical protein
LVFFFLMVNEFSNGRVSQNLQLARKDLVI